MQRTATLPHLHHVDAASHQSADQPEPERHVGPTLVTARVLFERVHRPEKWILTPHRGQALVRMPHALGVSVVEETLIELAPVVVPAEKSKARHELEPGHGEDDIRVC